MYGLFLLFSSLNYLSQVLAALSQLDRSSFGSKKTCGRIHSHFLPSLNRFILKLVFSSIFTLLRETLIGRKPYLGMTQHYPTLLNISKLGGQGAYSRHMTKTGKRVNVRLGRSQTQTRRATKNPSSSIRTEPQSNQAEYLPACHAVMNVLAVIENIRVANDYRLGGRLCTRL